MKLFCFGFGYTATVLSEVLAGRPDLVVAGTKRDPSRGGVDGVAFAAFQGDGPSPSVRALLADTTHVLISTPPGLEGCPAYAHHTVDLANLPSLAWVGYLSTVGVYGDHGGGLVDETTPVRPSSERALRRVQAEQSWQAFGRETGKRVEVFRLPGIYGPGRSVLDNLRAGTARRLIKPGQVFNRVHVLDIARALDAAMARPTEFDIYNVTDDLPSPPQDVVAYGAELLGLPLPPEMPFDPTRLTPMAASFYAENKRVSNARLKSALDFALLYPTYREGLLATLQAH